MLSPAEHDLAARDPALPGLGLLLDTELLAARLGWGQFCDPYLRYKPGTSCALAFRLTRHDPSAFLALAYPSERYAELRSRPKLRNQPEAVLFLDEHCLAVLPMAMDPDLPVLARLADEEKRRKTLKQSLGKRWAQARISLLRYNPNRRAVLRLESPKGRLALLKAYASEDWTRVLKGAQLAEAYGGAPVLAAAESEGLIAFRWIEGRPLWSDLSGLAGAEAVSAAGAALARLHAVAGACARLMDAEEEINALAAAATTMSDLLPALGSRAETLARAASRALGEHDRRRVLIHGDFSADQVVIARRGPIIVDWDRAGLGDPAYDLGSFLAWLDVQLLNGTLSQNEKAQARRAFLSGYGREAPIPSGLVAQHARALLQLISEAFRQRRADWPERATAILDRVEALLPSHLISDDPFGPLLRQAQDSSMAGPVVSERVGVPGGVPVDLELVRQKPGRRALVRYRFDTAAGPVAILGKLRARGPDRRTPRLHVALRDVGLDGRDPHRVGVPRPLGEIEHLHLWLQEELPGRVIKDFLRPGGPTLAARRAGEALASFHASGLEAPRQWTPADEIDVLRKSLDGAASGLPREADRLAAILSASSALASQLQPVPEVLIHRDWHPDQALLDGEVVWILDLDLHAQGDPALDLGNFAAHLAELSIRRHGGAAVLADHENAFLRGYAGAGGAARLDRVLAWKALALARLVGVSQRIHDRRPASLAILDCVERLLSGALGSLRVPVAS